MQLDPREAAEGGSPMSEGVSPMIPVGFGFAQQTSEAGPSRDRKRWLRRVKKRRLHRFSSESERDLDGECHRAPHGRAWRHMETRVIARLLRCSCAARATLERRSGSACEPRLSAARATLVRRTRAALAHLPRLWAPGCPDLDQVWPDIGRICLDFDKLDQHWPGADQVCTTLD